MVRKIGKDKACRESMQVNKKPYCCLIFPLTRKNSCSAFAVSLELFPKKVLGTTMPNLHPFADEIKHHPEVEVLPVTGDNRAEVMRKVSNWLADGVN
jgi:nucleoside-triphosphatase THEP1